MSLSRKPPICIVFCRLLDTVLSFNDINTSSKKLLLYKTNDPISQKPTSYMEPSIPASGPFQQNLTLEHPKDNAHEAPQPKDSHPNPIYTRQRRCTLLPFSFARLLSPLSPRRGRHRTPP